MANLFFEKDPCHRGRIMACLSAFLEAALFRLWPSFRLDTPFVLASVMLPFRVRICPGCARLSSPTGIYSLLLLVVISTALA